MDAEEQAIRALVDTWLAASQAGDFAGVLKLMADDVVFLTPGREPFGKKEFAAASKAMKGLRLEGEREIVELEVLGNWAWMRARLRVKITPPEGAPTVRSGHTLTIFRKEPSGAWVIARDANLITAEGGR